MNKEEKIWNPIIGEEIKGIYVDKLENQGKYESNLYKIETKKEIYSIWGSFHLNSLLELVSLGDCVLIRYVGLRKTKNHNMKFYELEILNPED